MLTRLGIEQMAKPNIVGFSAYELLADDPRFKLSKGDILIGSPYKYDPGKTSIAFRLSDGYRPQCNQYNSSIRRLSENEAEAALWA
jgi:hypothetical protein